MDLASLYTALGLTLSNWTKFGFAVFLQILIECLRPDIVDIGHKVEIVATDDLLPSYDFVVIGAGSAGSVIANRLSENANWTVLLLEAGGDEPVISDVPALHHILPGTELDWKFKTEPTSKACLAMNNHQCLYPRGKVLGGTSVLNWMMYVRGNKRDYDHWRDLGNLGWGYDDVLPYFKKSENNSIPYLQNSTYHGHEGYLSVESPKVRSPITANFMAAGFELGYGEVDYNGEEQTGFSYEQSTLRDGLRCSTAKAFLRPVSSRTNLHISTESMVEKILINETTLATYGVQFRRRGENRVVYVKNEVILSAGAFQSPQLLMLSGVGPQEHLEDVRVPVILNVPGVGQNLQDHVTIGGLSYLYGASTDAEPANSTDSESESPLFVTPENVDDFLNHKNGSLYFFLGSDAHGFVNSGVTDDSVDYPDVMLAFASTGDNMASFFTKRLYGFRDEFAAALWNDITNATSFQIGPMMLHPKSTGYIKLRNADPTEAPIINPNFLVDQADVDVLVKAAQIAHNMTHTVAMQKLNPRPNPNLTPECGSFNASSYEFFECHVRHYTMPVYHASGSCKMGPANDSMAVVDPRLRVYGVTGLRVADTSIMPKIVSGNTNAAAIMIGEKASDLIKEDYSYSSASEESTEHIRRRELM